MASMLGFLLLLPAAGAQAGSSNRYALIIGNNYGHSSTIELENLRHAEREVRRLGQRLIELGNFSPERVVIVTGQGRKRILQAAEELARVREQDRSQLGDLPSLFAVFFTGHGLSGKLLTADEPLSGEDLAGIFRKMKATLTLGFFDACYAGSLDLETLKAKGVVSTPGFNPVAELPDELINSEGTMWFASSRPEELSYEDDRLGGLFTHFFIEAFTRGRPDGVGITLDAMWEYARRNTLAHASRYGRSQTPEKIVRNLKARGPLYFSFTEDRSASLVFDPAVSGTFLLRYGYGALVEKVAKQPGEAREVPVYPGKLILTRIDSEKAQPSRHLDLAEGDQVHIRPLEALASLSSPGYGKLPIHSKGHIPGLELSLEAPAVLLSVGAGYRYSVISDGVLGTPHSAALDVWFARGPLALGLEVSYGSDSQDFDTWAYRLREIGLRLFAGVGFDLGGPRLDIEAGAGILFMDLKYASDRLREPLGGWLGAGARFGLPIPFRNPLVILQAQILLGARMSQGMSYSDRDSYWSFDPTFLVGLVVPVVGN